MQTLVALKRQQCQRKAKTNQRLDVTHRLGFGGMYCSEIDSHAALAEQAQRYRLVSNFTLTI
jgi:hypothetical protein